MRSEILIQALSHAPHTSAASHGLIMPILRDLESLSQGFGVNPPAFGVKTTSDPEIGRARHIPALSSWVLRSGDTTPCSMPGVT